MGQSKPILSISRADCQTRDEQCPLAPLRHKFSLPDNTIYLDGNSLGLLPVAARDAIAHAVSQEWGDGLIRSWNDARWFDLPKHLGNKLAPLIGAREGEVVVTDTTSINLYKAVMGALALRPERTVIVSEASSFPTDLYILEGAMGARKNIQRRLLRRADTELEAALDAQVAVVVLSHVDYRTGYLLDLGAITKAVHDVGALMIWDLSHSAGVVPVDVSAHNVDLAVGCTYKYLNGGPGSPAFVYCARRHQSQIRQPLCGWWGHARPFDFDKAYQPDPGIARFLCGTQPVLSMRAMEAGLDIARGANLALVRDKSQKLADLFITLIDSADAGASYGLKLASPRCCDERGAQVSYYWDHAYALVQAMIGRNIIGDFRAPDLMRFGFSPYYLRYVDVWDAAHCLLTCLAHEEWRKPQYHIRAGVT